jgi:hypothetical protein
MGPNKYNTWEKNSMLRAIMAVRNKEMGLMQASKLYEVPKSTMKGKVNGKEQNTEEVINIRIRWKTVLPETFENSIASYCLIM